MKRRTLIKGGIAGLASLYATRSYGSVFLQNTLTNNAAGPYQPSWDSLAQYQVPEWYRDAKFGIWAHWGPQCQPERGDWYARGMYEEGSDQYKYHCKKYGHPSKFGFKDVINEWKAENWDPEALVALYKKAGARYFVALANHHDNLDLYDSKHQRWNSTNVGPKKDLMAGWAKAAKKQGLPLGVSVHAAHAWRWYETAQRADKSGPMEGIPYDGKLTAADGTGKWWQGYDPQELYAQNHPLSQNSLDGGSIHGQWNWGNGVYPPSKAYCENFYNRTIDLIDKYEPELVYFDDTALPLWPIDDAGLRIAAHLYNKSIKKHGKLKAVINGKILDEQQRKCMVWDIERGQSNSIEPLPWQTDTCIGQWHYDRRVYENNHYKSAKTVIHTLIDVVSKNGNLLLNVPLRGDGSMDEKELAVVEGITDWMQINSESIYGTRPWKIFGEGPAMESAAALSAQGFNEGKGKPFGSSDIRFVKKGSILYATLLGWPEDRKALIKSLNRTAGKVEKVSLLGHKGAVAFKQNTEGLTVNLPQQAPGKNAFVLKINGNVV
ncbi:alpha-L-fucosidase [Pedobacter foliorum]|uniref:alpha-L-fucosidase n=1 Tax=Pedobacter foliorum TaxID=2739058 RepID=UPI001565D3B0|nr:alpha-L-fucosidase [Pedobacter foliorum]NRF37190.1 alpha-L-fucosidase [Pedobacter foliorum]